MIKLLVQKIMQNSVDAPELFAPQWSVQGLGMMRMYISPEIRLHVWDSTLVVPGASPIHTHPWSFRSKVIAGAFYNTRYKQMTEECGLGSWYKEQVIQCGVGGGLVGGSTRIKLLEGYKEVYQEGDKYKQRPVEIHETSFQDGTVTIITRTFNENVDFAKVYWPEDEEWGDAIPRPATAKEVHDVLDYSLNTWFK